MLARSPRWGAEIVATACHNLANKVRNCHRNVKVRSALTGQDIPVPDWYIASDGHYHDDVAVGLLWNHSHLPFLTISPESEVKVGMQRILCTQ
jgi:hypothetical protein